MSGVPQITHQAIRSKLLRLQGKWKSEKEQVSSVYRERRQETCICQGNVNNVLYICKGCSTQQDCLKCVEARKEYILLFMDQRDVRRIGLDKWDLKHNKDVCSQLAREKVLTKKVGDKF